MPAADHRKNASNNSNNNSQGNSKQLKAYLPEEPVQYCSLQLIAKVLTGFDSNVVEKFFRPILKNAAIQFDQKLTTEDLFTKCAWNYFQFQECDLRKFAGNDSMPNVPIHSLVTSSEIFELFVESLSQIPFNFSKFNTKSSMITTDEAKNAALHTSMKILRFLDSQEELKMTCKIINHKSDEEYLATSQILQKFGYKALADANNQEALNFILDLSARIEDNEALKVHYRKLTPQNPFQESDGTVELHWMFLPNGYNSIVKEHQFKNQQAMDVSGEESEEAFTVYRNFLEDMIKFKEYLSPFDYAIKDFDFKIKDRELVKENLIDPRNEKFYSPIDNFVQLVNSSQKPQENQSELVVKQVENILVPSYSSWFDYDSVSEIEKQHFTDFFGDFSADDSLKSTESYINYRNFMIDAYRLNPGQYLTFTACRRNLLCDANTLLRIHSFLEYWGLINYKIVPSNMPSQMLPPTTNNFNVVYDTPFNVYPRFGRLNNVMPANNVSTPPIENNLASEAINKTETKNEDSTTITDKNFEPVAIMAPNAAIEIDSEGNAKAAAEWTEQETLLLLEALEMHNEDWKKVAEHVKTRSVDECIMHFLQLPIQDPHLKIKDDSMNDFRLSNKLFAKSSNPLMSTISYLSSVLDPQAGANAAKIALDEYTKSNKIPKLKIDNEELDLEKASVAAFTAGALKAKSLADSERQNMRNLVLLALELQMKRIDQKLRHVESLESLLNHGQNHLDKQRSLLMKERQDFCLKMIDSAEKLNTAQHEIHQQRQQLENVANQTQQPQNDVQTMEIVQETPADNLIPDNQPQKEESSEQKMEIETETKYNEIFKGDEIENMGIKEQTEQNLQEGLEMNNGESQVENIEQLNDQ